MIQTLFNAELEFADLSSRNPVFALEMIQTDELIDRLEAELNVAIQYSPWR